MIITVIFLVSYLPRMITFLLEGIWAGLWETLTVEEYAIVRMLEVLYNVNHLANPFVYAFMDVKFVAELKKEISCGNQQDFQEENTPKRRLNTRWAGYFMAEVRLHHVKTLHLWNKITVDTVVHFKKLFQIYHVYTLFSTYALFLFINLFPYKKEMKIKPFLTRVQGI